MTAADGGRRPLTQQVRKRRTDRLTRVLRTVIAIASTPARAYRRTTPMHTIAGVGMHASSRPQSPGPLDITALLLAWAGGDRAALDALLPALYADLHAQAARALRREATG